MGAIANFAAGAGQEGANLFGQQALEQQKAQVDVMKAQRIAEINDQFTQSTEARHANQAVQLRQASAQRFSAALNSANDDALLKNIKESNPDGQEDRDEKGNGLGTFKPINTLADASDYDKNLADNQPTDQQLGRSLVRHLGLQGELSAKELVAENRSEAQQTSAMAKAEAMENHNTVFSERTAMIGDHLATADATKAELGGQLMDIKQQLADAKAGAGTNKDLPETDKAYLGFLTKRVIGLQSDLSALEQTPGTKYGEKKAEIQSQIADVTGEVQKMTGRAVSGTKPVGAIGAAGVPAKPFDPSNFMTK